MSAARRAAPALLAFAALTGAARAEGAVCSGAPFAQDGGDMTLMRVAPGAPRAHFIADADSGVKGCPSAAPACRLKNFLVPGDEVIAGRPQDGFICVTFRAPRAKETSGFLPQAALQETAAPALKLSDWAGKWNRVEASIEIKAADGRLAVTGDATYGAGDPRRVRSGGVNIGSIEGVAAPKGNVAALGEGYDGVKAPEAGDNADCLVRLRLFGRYLAVEDNMNCGGHNVTFTGVYLK